MSAKFNYKDFPLANPLGDSFYVFRSEKEGNPEWLKLSCKESTVYYYQPGDEAVLIARKERIDDFLHNISVINKELGLEESLKCRVEQDLYVIVEPGQFWTQNKVNFDMLACIFKHSRNFGQVNSIKELNRPSTLSAYSYFRQNTVIELLRNVKKLSDIVEEILNKKVDKAFFRYYDSNAIEEGDDDCDNDNLYYINGCISFATQFEDKIFSVLGGK